MAEPENMMLPLLRDLRAAMDKRFDSVETRLDGVGERFDRLDKKVENIRQAMHGESLMARYAVSEVDQRFEAIERRLEQLESKQ